MRLPAVLAALAVVLGACASAPAVALPAQVRSAAAWDPAHGPRPILVDTDLDGDDLIALAVLLRDPAVDVRAITVSGTGLVHCAPGLETARRLIAAFGRPEVPVACGRETPGPSGRAFPAEWRARADARLGLGLAPADAAGTDAGGTPTGDAAPALISKAIRAAGQDLLIVAIGPWTNLADAFAADPSLAQDVAGIHAMLGTIDAPGNVVDGITDADDRVEWNAGADPDAVARVLALDIPVTLVPLDATDDVPVPPDMPARLDRDHVAAGADLAYELYLRNPAIAEEGQQLWDSLAALLVSDPSLATWEDAAVDITTRGAAAGRLARADRGRPIRFATSARPDAAIAGLIAALRRGSPRTQPFATVGEIAIRWDGTTCAMAGPAPQVMGEYLIRLDNTTDAIAFAGVAGVRPPNSWADAQAWIAAITPENAQPPDWIAELGSATATGDLGIGLTTIPSGAGGVFCIAGSWPDVRFIAGPGWSLDR